MTRDEIIQMACDAFHGIINQEERDHFVRFAALVAEAEREACAKICEDECADPDDQFKSYEDTHHDGWQDGCNSCAWAIRERSKQ